MSRFYSLLAIGLVISLSACVTINVYFPEAAAERAADRFIQDVIGDNGRNDSPTPPPPTSGNWHWSDLLIARAHAQTPNINIDTPQVQAIKARMAERHRNHLADWFGAGAIGLSNNGLVEIRDRAAVPLAERRNLERVIGEENADRNAVYREIAIANGQPDWEADIRQTFARQWIANAREGWYYQQSDGNWTQK